MFYDDIAINIITKSRNNELSVLFVNMFLTSIAKSYVSFRRMGIYIKDCPPNFYISDNKFTGSANVSSIIADTTDQLPNDTVVYFRDASFTWVHTRNDLLNKKYDTFLKNLNFELKRGEIAIVTGSKGSGKSNFIKSMLGEMTLVGGSMAVVPLHTSMPIFYASQDIFLQQGTIRSNITFGYRFDEHIYNTVLKAVELEFDISTWDKGDLRVVSDRAHSLSGGQRVRMELARAVYAYLVFHQVNTEYNNSQCSFLMCLDASFHGLDPYVSKTIFNNLFNLKTGLLVKNDLSVVLTTSKQTLDICSKTSDINQVNSVCENAISGSSIYRSYKNELALVIDLIENTDYYIRTEAFGKFSKTYAKIEIYTCSLKRFTHFIPPGQKLKFGKFVNSHEEYIIKPANNGVNRVNKLQLLRRRAIEFKAENTKFYGLKRIFYHPKIHIMDVENYITPDHTGVELKNACVYTRPDFDPESMILKHLTVAATKSEIIGIVGRTGAGKTTLLSVLQNLSTNRTGQVLLDGKDLNDIPKVVLRQIIGVLPQLPFVFKGWTIRRFLDPRRLFTDDEINQALNKCALLNFVNELPGGLKLDTLIVPDDLWINPNKPKNSNLNIKELEKKCSTSTDLIKASFETDMIISNSQLRTLTLARLVLYKDFYRVIIVDEPPEEDLFDASIREDDLGVPIYDLLQKHFSHCTTFVTAHDVNVLKTCTSVWVIHEGCLVRTCKTSDIAANESIASIIEENVKSG
nr:ABC transporter [Theileria orientalis]